MKNSDKRDEDEIKKMLCAMYGIQKPVAWRLTMLWSYSAGGLEELYTCKIL